MPIEIKELVIRAVAQAEGPHEAAPPAGEEEAAVDFDALVAACVRQVLRILRNAKER